MLYSADSERGYDKLTASVDGFRDTEVSCNSYAHLVVDASLLQNTLALCDILRYLMKIVNTIAERARCAVDEPRVPRFPSESGRSPESCISTRCKIKALNEVFTATA